MVDLGEETNSFVCPNDRQLALRAKLKTGWSVKSKSFHCNNHLEPIDAEEQQVIIDVIKRNEKLESLEEARVGKLIERLENMRRNALGKTQNQCLLCGDRFGFLGAQKLRCVDCKQPVCNKCSIESNCNILCLICSESREIWKKSGAWFFKSLPKYVLPGQFAQQLNLRPLNSKSMQLDDDSSDEERKPWKILERRNSATECTHQQDLDRQSSSNSETFFKETDSILNDEASSRRESIISRSFSDLYDDRVSPGASSMASLFKNPIDENKPLDTSNGIIELSLSYDPNTCTLHVCIYRCKNLVPMDINGLADPYCKINVLPSVKATRLRTKTVHKSRNPEFNEHCTFYDLSQSDLAKKSLHVIVVDDDKYGHDYMGEIRYPLVKLRIQNTIYLTMPLERLMVEMKGPLPELNEWFDDLWSRGQILVSLCYNTKKKALLVTIIKCTNLLPMDNNGFSDPFVKLFLKPDPYHRKYKTSIKWKNLNPIFNEEFAFESRPTALATQSLFLAVWDKDYGKSNDYLGGLVLGGVGSKGRRLKHWLDMIRYPDHRHECWHNLTDDQNI